MGKLVAMPDAPIFVSIWEGNGICAAAKEKCDKVCNYIIVHHLLQNQKSKSRQIILTELY